MEQVAERECHCGISLARGGPCEGRKGNRKSCEVSGKRWETGAL